MVEWLVKPGDYVHRGDVVAVVDTDKTVMDIESFEEGVVAELLVDIGATVPIGTPLARITATPDDGSPAAERPAGTPGLAGRAAGGAAPGPPAPAAPAEAARAEHPGAVSPPVRHLAHVLGVDPATVRGTGRHGAVTRSDVERAAVPAAAARPDGVDAGEPGRVRSSPRARRLAAERGLDLASFTGTGPGGAVREEDVLQAVGAAPSTRPPPRGRPSCRRPPRGLRLRQRSPQRKVSSRRRAGSVRRAFAGPLGR